MNSMLIMQTAILLMVGIAGTAVVVTRDPASQAVGISFYGLLLTLMFFLFQAPDVALSQIVVGAVALPLMIVLALAKIRMQNEQREQEQQNKEPQHERKQREGGAA